MQFVKVSQVGRKWEGLIPSYLAPEYSYNAEKEEGERQRGDSGREGLRERKK